MKSIVPALITGLLFLVIACSSTAVIPQPVPDGYQGIYVVKVWEGDNSVLPKDITGLVFRRTGNTYDIVLSNVDEETKSAEEIEDLKFTYVNGEFLIKFGGIMKVKPEIDGLRGSLNYDGKPAELYLKKIK